MNETNDVFQQDLSGEYKRGLVFTIQLLMKEKCSMPAKDTMDAVMKKHLGNVNNFAYDDKSAGYEAAKYKAVFEEREVPPLLMMTECCEFDPDTIDAFKRSQLWDCPEHDKILDECKYQVIATDMFGAAVEAADRAEMLMDFLEALIELYPSCEAVYFQNSDKMFTAKAVRECPMSREDRFVYFAVNVRFFNIQGTEDMLVDSLGMSVLFMPDVQYHFHGADPNYVVQHAYTVLSYIFAANCPIKNGDTIDGLKDGEMSADVQWKCHFEDSLIQPTRPVIDICMNEFASGDRDYKK
jgi:hypothetical protein